MNEQNNATIVTTCNQRIKALETDVSPKTSVTINGTTHKPADVVGIYQSALDTRAAVITARALLAIALAKRKTADAARKVTDKGLRGWVSNQFGEGSQELLNFGFAPAKKATRTAIDKAQSVLLGQATRKARGTRGKRQKEEIHGTLAAAPPAPAPAIPPAPSITAPPAVVTGPATSH